MIVVDSSVAVAAALPWHERHVHARASFPRLGTRLVAHVALETYSVLTRLPTPFRVPAAAARDYLAQTFASPPIALGAEEHEGLLDDLSRAGIVGGAVYDALVAVTARSAGATLISLDQRAARAYQVLGAPYRLLD